MKPISRWSFASFTEVLNHSLQALVGRLISGELAYWLQAHGNGLKGWPERSTYFLLSQSGSMNSVFEPEGGWPFQISEASGSQLPSMRRGLARILSRAWPGHLQMIPNRAPLQDEARQSKSPLRHMQTYPLWVSPLICVNLNPRWNCEWYYICLHILILTDKHCAVLMASEASFRVTWPPELRKDAYLLSACGDNSTRVNLAIRP